MSLLKRSYLFILIILISINLPSCLSHNGVTYTNFSFPIGIRAKKKKIQPPKEFVDALFEFKKNNGHWPITEREFQTYATSNRRVFERFYDSGFISWNLGRHSLDSLEIHFVHQPVYNQTLGILAFPGREVKLRTLFIASTQTHKTSLKKK